MIEVVFAPTFEAFREAARPLLASRVDPSTVRLRDERVAQRALFAAAPRTTAGTVSLPASFLRRAEELACARDEDRWDLLYRVAYRLTHGDRELLERPTDDDVARMRALERAVREDVHRMHAFVRFRRTPDDRYIAWHRPDHYVLRLAAPFFARRFPNMRWSILTPDESVTFDGALSFGPGAQRDEAPPEDELDELFRSYYGATFNPARVNPKKLLADLPARFHAALPEARSIGKLIDEAPARVAEMHERMLASASPVVSLIPPRATLPMLREAAQSCAICDGCERTNGVVFGEGPNDARIVLVGEQPGDREDTLGRPFVGPAGQLLDEILDTLSIDRRTLYLTNAVKHFHYEPRGKQRLHRTPKVSEIDACRPWLEAELAAIAPRAILCLGAVAARSFMGHSFRLHKARGRIESTRWAPLWSATHHPAAILRMADSGARASARRELTEDLARIAEAAHGQSGATRPSLPV